MGKRLQHYVLSALAVGCCVTGTVEAQRPVLDSAARSMWAALLAVQDRRALDTVIVDRALNSPLAPLRAAAARVIGGNRITARYAALRQRLGTETDTAAARDAAFALGLAQDSQSCAALRDALTAPTLGAAAAWALGELGATCGEFSALLASARTSPARAGLLRVAGKWTPFPDSVVVHAFTTSVAPTERWAALYALARGRRSAGAALAVDASRSSDASLRDLAARLLLATVQPARDSLRVVARLDTLLMDRVPHVRIAAVRALATWRSVARVPFAHAWTRERDANVRVTMAQSIGTVLSDTSTIWRSWWESDTTHMVRRSLVASAWQANAIAALTNGDISALDTASDYRLRIAMVEGAAAAGGEPYLPRVLAHLDDRDGRVRAAAVSAVARLSSDVREMPGWNVRLARALQDDDVGVRTAALSARRRGQTLGLAADAVAGYERSMRDSVSDAREAALDLLTAAWRADSGAFADTLRAQIRGWPTPADPLLIPRVRQFTPLAHWQREVTYVPSPAEYERIVRDVVARAVEGRPPVLSLATDRGVVRIVLDGVSAPMTSDHLLRLVRTGYFRNLRFHRVVPAFVAQGGDPRGDGTGGPGYAIRDELNRSPYVRGAVGMALSGPDTGGSQFFLTLSTQPHLDGHYTVFGHVLSGQAVVDAIMQGDGIRNITAIPQ